MCRSPEELVATLGVLESRGVVRAPRRARAERRQAGATGSPPRRRRQRRGRGAAERRAAPGEWRTNVSLGGQVAPAEVPPEARELAARAVAAVEIDLAGVDLLLTGGRWVVLELNGAVDFDRRYALPGIDPYASILDAYGIRRATTSHVDPERSSVMSKTVQGKPPRAGDEIVITGHSVGDAPRTALILSVLGEPGHERYHVRWEDGHESIFFPAEDAVVRRPTRRRAATG